MKRNQCFEKCVRFKDAVSKVIIAGVAANLSFVELTEELTNCEELVRNKPWTEKTTTKAWKNRRSVLRKDCQKSCSSFSTCLSMFEYKNGIPVTVSTSQDPASIDLMDV